MSLSSGRTSEPHRQFIDDDIYDASDDHSIGSDDEDNHNISQSRSEDSPRKRIDKPNNNTNGKKRPREVAALTTETETSALVDKARTYAEKPIELFIYRKEHKHVNRVNEQATSVSIQHCQLLVTHERNLLVGARDEAESFENCLDHYASLHPDVVYGMRLLDLANAFFPIRSITPSLTDVNTEPTVTGVPIGFFAMVREVAKALTLHIDRIYPLLSTAYIPTQISLEKNKKWQSESDLFKGAFDPANRRFPRDRVIPVYLIPHFFATHPALRNHPHNNAILFGHRLIREMERRVPAKYLDNSYMDCLRQLYANFDKLAYHFTARTEMLSVLLERMDHLNAMYESLFVQHEKVIKALRPPNITDSMHKIVQTIPLAKGSAIPSSKTISQQKPSSDQTKKPSPVVNINALMLDADNEDTNTNATEEIRRVQNLGSQQKQSTPIERKATPSVDIFALVLDSDDEAGEGEAVIDHHHNNDDDLDSSPNEAKEPPLKRQRLDNA